MPAARARGQLGGRGATAEGERQLQLLAEQRQDPPRALLAADRKPPEGGATDQHRVGAQGEGDRDVDAAADSAVDEHRSTPGDRVDHLGQRVGGRQAAVELAAAVVGDDDGGGAVLDREGGVLGGHQPLDHHRQAALGGQRLEVRPGQGGVHQVERLLDRHRAPEAERRLDARHPDLLRDLEAGPRVALAVAPARRVDGDHDRLEAGGDRLVDQRPGDALVPEAVELEPAPARRGRGGDLARPRRRQGREAHHRPRRRRRPAPSPSSPSGSTSRW